MPALREVLDRCSETTWLLLENSAGAGGTIGRSIDELAILVDALDRHPRLGVCLDSCHLYVSGIDVGEPKAVATVLAEVDDRIGLDRLRALHVNDAAAPLGSNRDRHANVLEGELGERLGAFLAHPAVQTPPGADGDPRPGRPRPRRRGDAEAARPPRPLDERERARLTKACVDQHKPLLRPRVLERVEGDREVDDARRADGEQASSAAARTAVRAAGASAPPARACGSCGSWDAATRAPRRLRRPARHVSADRDVVPVERDHESMDPRVESRECEPH